MACVDGASHGTVMAGTVVALGNNDIGVAGVVRGVSVQAIRLIRGRSSLGGFKLLGGYRVLMHR